MADREYSPSKMARKPPNSKRKNLKQSKPKPLSRVLSIPHPSRAPFSPKPTEFKSTDTLEKSCRPELREYHPQKTKRQNVKKRTTLKHQYNLKEIKRTNKRKMACPQKGQQIEHKDPNRVVFAELTMFEIIRFLEDTGMLDDESFDEIVDCPSPVWWEDPPDDSYSEDPIDRELVREALEGIRESPPPIEEDVQIRVQLLNKEIKNEKLLEKKSKLENILGNIKNRAVKIKVENSKRVDTVKNEVENEKNDSHTDGDDNRHKSNESRLSVSSESDIFSDISISEDELLKNLETIEIPIKTTPMQETGKKDVESIPETMPPLLKFPCQSTNAEFEKNTLTESSKSKNSVISFSETSVMNEASTSTGVASPPNSLSETPKSSLSEDALFGDFDSISDTNIRFLDDDDVEMLTGDVGNNEEDNLSIDNTQDTIIDNETIIERETDVNVSLDQYINSLESGNSDNSDLVTVYSIISETEMEESEEKEARKLKTYQNKSRHSKLSPFSKNLNTSVVSEEEKASDNIDRQPISTEFSVKENKAIEKEN